MRVALTVDAEHPDYPTTHPRANAELVLDVLARAGIPATFFVQGKWASTYPDLARAICQAGHQVGSHSHAHCHFTWLAETGIVDDLQASRDVLEPLCGEIGDWFRLPAGMGHGQARIAEAVARAGFRHVHWTIITGDWAPGWGVERVASDIVDHVMGLGDHDVAVPVVHSWPDVTPLALAQVIERLDGVEYVRLDDLGPDEIPR